MLAENQSLHSSCSPDGIFWRVTCGGVNSCNVVRDLHLFFCRVASLSALELWKALRQAAPWFCKVN